MPTPTEYQKQLLHIVRSQLMTTSYTQHLFDWIEGRKSYVSGLDKYNLIHSLEQLEKQFITGHQLILKTLESLDLPISAQSTKKKGKK